MKTVTAQSALSPESAKLLKCLGLESLVQLQTLYETGQLQPSQQATQPAKPSTPGALTEATPMPTDVIPYQSNPNDPAATQIHQQPARRPTYKGPPNVPVNTKIPSDPAILESPDRDWVLGRNPYTPRASVVRTLLARENSDLGIKRIVSRLLRREGIEKAELSVETKDNTTKVDIECSYRISLATINDQIPEVKALMSAGRKDEAINWLNLHQKEFTGTESAANLHSILHRVLTDLLQRFPTMATKVVQGPHVAHAITDRDGTLWEVANAHVQLHLPRKDAPKVTAPPKQQPQSV
jgi:hypothetical protein